MNKVIELGHLSIQYMLLIYFMSGILGYGTVVFLAKQDSNKEEKRLSDLVLTCLIIPILVWKLGPIFLHPVRVIHQPLLLLFSKGTGWYWVVGGGISILFFVNRVWKERLDIYLIMDRLTIGFIVFLGVSQLFIKEYGRPTHLFWGVTVGHSKQLFHPVNFYSVALILILAAWYIFKRYRLGEGRVFCDFLIFMGIGNMIISFTTLQQPYFLSLSLHQWFFMLAICLGWLLPRKKEQSDPIS